MILNFRINGQRLRRYDDNYVVNLSKEYLQCNFQFSDDWTGLSKFVTFSVKGRYYRFELSGDSIRVPNDVLRYKYFYVKVHGADGEGERVITTDELIIVLKVSGYSDVVHHSLDGDVTDVYTVLKQKIDAKVDHFRLDGDVLVCYSGDSVVQIIPLSFLDDYYDKDEINSLLNETFIDVDVSELAESGYLIFERYDL